MDMDSTSSPSSITQEVEAVKKELVDLIVTHLQEQKIGIEEAQNLARDFLAVLPIADHKDLLEKLKTLGTTYSSAQKLYVDELGKEEVQKRDIALNQMRDHIQNGQIDHAVAVAKNINGGVA